MRVTFAEEAVTKAIKVPAVGSALIIELSITKLGCFICGGGRK